MLNNKALIISLVLVFFLSISTFSYAAAYVAGTPAKYEVTLKKVELSQDGGTTWITIAEGSQAFDIASANAGTTVGTFISGASIIAGTYNKIRTTITRSFVLESDGGIMQQAGAVFANTRLYTAAGTYTTTGGASTVNPLLEDEQTVNCPTDELPTGITYDAANDNFLLTADIDFTVTDKTTAGNILIQFDLTNTLALYPDATFFPMPPTISLTTTN